MIKRGQMEIQYGIEHPEYQKFIGECREAVNNGWTPGKGRMTKEDFERDIAELRKATGKENLDAQRVQDQA